jgi:hypothetical protein
MEMRHEIAFATIIALTFAFPVIAAAQEGGPVELPDCGGSVPVSRTMLAGASFTGGTLGTGSAYLVATLAGPGRGTVLFVRDRAGQWHGHSILGMSSILGTFQTQRSSDIFAWAWNDAEGPGSSFTGIHVLATGERPFCVDLTFPAELSQPAEFLTFAGFNIAHNGRGVVIGEADVERGGAAQRWIYRYDSSDYGRTWSRPTRVSAAPATQGSYHAVTGSAPQPLVQSLLAQAR